MIILDEIHMVKNEDSKRREGLEHLISNVKRKNKEFKLLGLSATPIINHLKEGKSLLELITGIDYDDLQTRPYLMNAVKLYQHLTNISIRYLVDYKKANLLYTDVEAPFPEKKDYPHIRNSPLGVEVLLTEARKSEIVDRIDGPTLIYTEYVGKIPGHQCIVDILGDAAKQKVGEDNVGFYTGEKADGLQLFLDGDIQVLIASRPISVGVDDLQYRCKNLIFNSLPWTNAAYRQIIGRIVRTGMDDRTVNIHHIRARFPGVLYDEITKLRRIDYKKALADCAVDGTMPEGVLVTPERATKEAMLWIERLNRGEVSIVNRREWDRQLTPAVEKKLLRKLGDFSKMNQAFAIANSSTMHKKLIKENEFKLLDARSKERFDGKVKEPRPGVRSGSIEDSICLPYSECINPKDNSFLDKKIIDENSIVLFMKGTKDAPVCGFSNTVVQLLNHYGVNYKDVNILEDPQMRPDLSELSGWPTFPQLFVKGKLIGGADIAVELHDNGELLDILDVN